MGQTIVEKVIARASGRVSTRAGEIVTVKVDFAMANDITLPLALRQLDAAGVTRVFDPARICVMAGRHAPFKDAAFAEVVAGLGRFCAEQGIAHYDGFGEGMDHALAPERGLIRPGMLICNADSHTCTYGALNALGVPMGSTDIAYVLAFGETWLRVPETIKVEYSGTLRPFVTSKDLVLATLAQLGVDGARYRAIEFCGPALRSLSVDERFTITNMAIEMGAKTGLMEADDRVDAYLAVRTREPWTRVASDADARFERTVKIDAGALEPLVAKPFLPSNVVPARELQGTRITQVNIGTCTNGRLVDLEQAASVLRGHKVARGLRVMITPATREVYQAALKKGLLEVFVDSGCMVNPPGCGPCSGFHMGALAEGEVALTTHNRNFRGRMGHLESQVYLTSPYVAAASAIAGTIASPSDQRA